MSSTTHFGIYYNETPSKKPNPILNLINQYSKTKRCLDTRGTQRDHEHGLYKQQAS